MRFGLVHRIMTSALATLGILALVTSGNLGTGLTIGVLVALAVALAVPEGWKTQPVVRHIASFGPLGLLGVQLIRLLAFDATILDTAVEFAIALQIVRLATRVGAAHDQQVIILALLHLIAGTMLGGGISYGLCFVASLIVIPGALVLSHLRREVEGNYRQGARDRTGLPVDVPRILRSRRVVGKRFILVMCLLSVPIFLFTALLFVAFPRVGLSLLLLNQTRTDRMVGFSDRIDLGEVGSLRSDPTLALRVHIPDLPDPPPPRIELHLRGTAFDTYDGRAWSRSQAEGEALQTHFGVVRLKRRPKVRRGDKKITIDLEPIDPPVLFVPRRAVALRMQGRTESAPVSKIELFAGAEGELRYRSQERGARYEVWLGGENERSHEVLSEEDKARYLALPPNLPPRIGELARAIIGNRQGVWEKANEIQEHLRENYRYDLSSPSGAAADPLDDFLFTTRSGHCEFYSTAMVVLLRELGIPARNVTGFLGASYNRFGNFYAVRQGDAHSWVEVFIDELGWTTFDPTPAADAAPQAQLSGFLASIRDFIEATSQRWDRHVIGYDLHQQVSTFQRLSGAGRSRGLSLSSNSPRQRAIASVLLGCVVVSGVAFWYARRRRSGKQGDMRAARRRDRDLELASALYSSLEAAMTAQGVPRSSGTPPLRHAEALRATGHPLGPEILALTQVYLDARFGGATLSDEGRRDFEGRVKRVRAARLATVRVA